MIANYEDRRLGRFFIPGGDEFGPTTSTGWNAYTGDSFGVCSIWTCFCPREAAGDEVWSDVHVWL